MKISEELKVRSFPELPNNDTTNEVLPLAENTLAQLRGPTQPLTGVTEVLMRS